ncbi:calpastatin isoform X2 [Falco naumanni]|uniref:calpastatin isoform X2 n=1 Tax=Falco naumanni TaxID=148594 RepID=UPI001ADE212A|nr:calpastatin isoform X2 [Falco naumanni]
MSQAGKGRQPPLAASAAHGDKKTSETSSKLEEKKAEATEKKPASANLSQAPKTQTSGGGPSAVKQSPSADTSKPQIVKPSEKKSTPTTKTESGKTMQSYKPTDSANEQQFKMRQNDQDPSGPSSECMSMEAGAAGAGTGGASISAATVHSSTETGMDELAVDKLIDSLAELQEEMSTNTVYSGPEVKEDVFSSYLEELGKREGSLPPEYVKLLKSRVDGRDELLPKEGEEDEKPLTEDEIAEALASDFTCVASAGEKIRTLTEEMEGEAVEALLNILSESGPVPEDLAHVAGMSQAKEKTQKKAEECDDTIPQHRLTLELDKDGKPILPKTEEKPKLLSESDVFDELSKDFDYLPQPAVQSIPSKPSSTSKKPSDPVSAKTTEDEVAPHARTRVVHHSAPSAESSVGHMADEALEALSSSLGKREPDPDEGKPAVDKVKETNEQEQRKKLGEDEETIPPDYRLTEEKDKDGKPLLPKPEEKPQPMSENELSAGLTEGFSCSPPSSPLPTPTVIKKIKKDETPADSLDVIAAATVPSVRSAAPLASHSGGKEMDEALDLLSDSLGQREPDPDDNKPVVDKVKEEAKSEHRDKLGERDDTIPPDYQKLLESGEQGKPEKPTAKDDVKQKGKKRRSSFENEVQIRCNSWEETAVFPNSSPDHCSASPVLTLTPNPQMARKVRRKPSARNQPQRVKEKPKTLKRGKDSPPAANLRSRKRNKH